VSEASPTLEERLARIEAIVGRLESDRLDLDEALLLFEEGVAHLREADRVLREAELRVERLVAGAGGSVIVEPVRREPEE
jgi:exodeoxyribonuclease VII small subunit